MKKTIGFIGLGIMGKPMVRNLLKAGYTVYVYDIHKDSMEEVTKKGAIAQTCAYDVAHKADVTITMVPNTPHVEQVIFGEGGIINALKEDKIYIDMGTTSAVETRKFVEKICETGAKVLDAPVSGGEKGAIEGTLAIMVGGEEKVYEACKDIFEVLGTRIHHVGNNSAGQVVKTCNQVLVSGIIAAMSEALVLGTKSGVDPQKMIEVLNGGSSQCWAIDVRAPHVVQRDFQPGFKSYLSHKDVGLALELSQNINVPMPITGVVSEIYKSIMAKGLGEEDHTNIIKIYEQLAGVEVKTEK